MEVKAITLNVHGQKVSGKFYAPTPDGATKNLALLFLHGWTGKPNEKAAAVMAEQGFYCLTISMRGHNDSDGDITEITSQNSLDDAAAAYDFLSGQVPSGTAIAAVGNSYGSYIAVLLSGIRTLSVLSLRVPAAYPDEGFDQPKWGRGHDDPDVDAWRHQPVKFSDNKAFKLLHDFSGNVQILEGEKDEVIPKQTVQNYIHAVTDPAKLEYIVLKNWPHSMGDDPQKNKEFQEILLDWATKQAAAL